MIELPYRGHGTQLRHLLELLDGNLADVYARDGLNYRPRFTPIMRALIKEEGLTIKALAVAAGISHSAASQTISKMTHEGFLIQKPGQDGRERLIFLSRHGKQIAPRLQLHWQAVQKAADALDAELSLPLSQIATEAIDALTDKSFAERISDQRVRLMEATK